MSETFENRPWFYWVILLVLVAETLYVAFRILPLLAAVVVEQPSAKLQWDLAPVFLKVTLLSSLAGLIAGVVVSILLIMRRRTVVKYYFAVVLLAMVALAYKISLINADMDDSEIGGIVGGIIGSSVQLGLTLWGLSVLSRSENALAITRTE